MSRYGYILRCEVQNDTGRLPDLTWSQGATPRIVATPTRGGNLVGADAETVARMMIAPAPTSELWAVVESAATEGGGYVLQWPTVGAHTTPDEPWFYTIYFMRDGKRYWTGSGRLFIEETSATGDGLVWQEVATWEDMIEEAVGILENSDLDKLTLDGVTIQKWSDIGSVAGVESLNGLTGAVEVEPGSGIGITKDGQKITISNTQPAPTPTTVNGKSGAVTLTAGSGISITETQGEGANGVTIASTVPDPTGNFVPLVADSTSAKTAVTIGSRASGQTVGVGSIGQGNGVVASGAYSSAHGNGSYASGQYAHAEGESSAAGDRAHAEGDSTSARGEASHSEGLATIAIGIASHASGKYATASHNASFAWSGKANDEGPYESHGQGTFNIDPVGGAAGFYIGNDSLQKLLDGAGGGAETARVVTTATATVEDGDGLILMDTATAGQAQTLTLPATMEADAATVTVRQLGGYGVTITGPTDDYELTYSGDWVTIDWISGKGWFWRA